MEELKKKRNSKLEKMATRTYDQVSLVWYLPSYQYWACILEAVMLSVLIENSLWKLYIHKLYFVEEQNISHGVTLPLYHLVTFKFDWLKAAGL